MADELAKITGDIDGVALKSYSCVDGTALAKGRFLVVSDPRLVAKHTAVTEAFVGICETDKDASDGQVRVACWPRGSGVEFEFTADGTVAAGDVLLLSSVANRLTSLDLASGNSVLLVKAYVGIAIETASDGETCRGVLA